MRTFYRVVTTLVGVVAAVPFGMGTASANTAQPGVIQGAWYWHDQTVVVGPEPVNPPATATGVPAKDLAVAFKGDDGTHPDKVMYLAWDVSGIPTGSLVSKFQFTMTVDSAPQAVQAAPPDYKLVACGAIGDFTPAEAGSFANKPGDDCSSVANGTFDSAKKTWTFDVAAYAQHWANGDPASGIGILPAPGTTTPFQVVFQPASTVTTVVEFSPPGPVAVPETVVTPVTPPDTNVAPPPAFVPAAPQASAAPSAAPPVVALPPVRRVQPAAGAAPSWPKQSGVPSAFWGAALAAVVLLGVAALILGDATVRVEPRRRRTLTRLLRERQTHSGPQAQPQTRIRTV